MLGVSLLKKRSTLSDEIVPAFKNVNITRELTRDNMAKVWNGINEIDWIFVNIQITISYAIIQKLTIA